MDVEVVVVGTSVGVDGEVVAGALVDVVAWRSGIWISKEGDREGVGSTGAESFAILIGLAYRRRCPLNASLPHVNCSYVQSLERFLITVRALKGTVSSGWGFPAMRGR